MATDYSKLLKRKFTSNETSKITGVDQKRLVSWVSRNMINHDPGMVKMLGGRKKTFEFSFYNLVEIEILKSLSDVYMMENQRVKALYFPSDEKKAFCKNVDREHPLPIITSIKPGKPGGVPSINFDIPDVHKKYGRNPKITQDEFTKWSISEHSEKLKVTMILNIAIIKKIFIEMIGELANE